MGMLATVLNSLALRDVLEHSGLRAEVFSAVSIGVLVKPFNSREVDAVLEAGSVAIFAGGTGNPFVTTDSAASLRAVEINADVLLKATKVDGVYSADPKKDKNATLYKSLTYKEALDKELSVMDLAAFCQCRDYNIPIRVFNVFKEGALTRALEGGSEGTLVSHGE
jgi:uridylate kinase